MFFFVMQFAFGVYFALREKEFFIELHAKIKEIMKN